MKAGSSTCRAAPSQCHAALPPEALEASTNIRTNTHICARANQVNNNTKKKNEHQEQKCFCQGKQKGTVEDGAGKKRGAATIQGVASPAASFHNTSSVLSLGGSAISFGHPLSACLVVQWSVLKIRYKTRKFSRSTATMLKKVVFLSPLLKIT